MSIEPLLGLFWSLLFFVVGLYYFPRSRQSYRNMSDLRFLSALCLLGLGIETLLRFLEVGVSGMCVGLVLGAWVVRQAERGKQG